MNNHSKIWNENYKKSIAMKYMLLLFSFLMTINTLAQPNFSKQSDVAFVYKLTNEQALILAQKGKEAKEKAMMILNQLGNPIDTLDLIKNEATPKYSIGHYVVVRTVEERLDYQFLSFNNIGIVPIQKKKKFQFYIVDTTGQFENPDKVTLDGKELKQKKGTEFYS
ncbi:MAG: hypothetical protein ACI97N_000129, partial [Cognaticolwellia sp.]